MTSLSSHKQLRINQYQRRLTESLLVLIGMIAFSLLFEYLFPFDLKARLLVRSIGLSMIVFALIWAIYSIAIYRDHLNQCSPQTTNSLFINKGPYLISRNPYYLAVLIMQWGCGLAISEPWVLIHTCTTYVLLNDYIIPKREQKLADHYGQAWYFKTARVTRWICWPIRRTKTPLVFN